MKNILATILYAGFVLLALRAQAATTGEAGANAKARADVNDSALIEQANTALSEFRAAARPALLDQAQAALDAVLAHAPDDYVAQRTAVAVLLARHGDSEALARITALNQRFPDDVDTYGFLIDAELALGRYGDAERDTQRLLDLRPDNVPGLIRAARLRELYGDRQGAIDFLGASLNRITEDQREPRAALYTQLARLNADIGQDEVAGQALTAALASWPDYAPALAEGLRRARLRGAPEEALTFARQLYRVQAGAHELLLLARATAAAGQGVKAAPLFQDFVARAHAIAARDDNANLDLASYYAYEGHDPARAVSFAASARAQRADVETLMTYATALHRAARDSEAHKVVATLRKLGYRDPDFVALATALHDTVASADDITHSLP